MRTFSIGYSNAKELIVAMEGDVIKIGELERYTAFLKINPNDDFKLGLMRIVK